MSSHTTDSSSINRLEVEGGFLDGLDLTFAPGLNTIIGARGTGKTSIVELIRFCLEAPAMTDLTATRAREHALAVLGDGTATVTLLVGGEHVRVSRSAYDDSVEYAATLVAKPLVFAQNEIEVVARDADSRRRLLDTFSETSPPAEEEQTLLSALAVATGQIRTIVQELEMLSEERTTVGDVSSALAEAEKKQQDLLSRADASKPDQGRSAELDAELGALRVRSSALERAVQGVAAWEAEITAATAARPALDPWPRAAGAADLFGPLRTALNSAEQNLRSALEAVSEGRQHVSTSLAATKGSEARLAEEAREVRSRLEAAAAGSGAAARRVAELRQRQAHANSLSERETAARTRLVEAQQRRVALLDDLERLRERRFDSRLAAARELSSVLGPDVQIDVQRQGALENYSNAIIESLKGSQIRYKNLAPVLARAMSPRELVEAIEQNRPTDIAQLAGIDVERAQRVVSYLREHGTEQILGVEIEDLVDISLLDGGVYKPVEQLSTGQRCTAVLATVLQQREKVIVVDQPEDHLDNAYVAKTLVHAIRQRGPNRQLIVTTHNPNIPVLGEAQQVVVLESDGSSGYVESAEPLDTPPSIRAITEIMEGGLEALKRRAAFYASGQP